MHLSVMDYTAVAQNIDQALDNTLFALFPASSVPFTEILYNAEIRFHKKLPPGSV